MFEIKKVNRHPKRGFSLAEFVIGMAVIALILCIAIPNFQSIQQDDTITKVDGDLDTLKMAVTSYWKNNGKAYPMNIHSALTAASPSVIEKVLADPWITDQANSTYGFIKGADTAYGEYFIIYTKGPVGDTVPTWDGSNKRVNYNGSGRVVSNAPIVRQ